MKTLSWLTIFVTIGSSDILLATTFAPEFEEPNYEYWTEISTESLELANVILASANKINVEIEKGNKGFHPQLKFIRAIKKIDSENITYYITGDILGPCFFKDGDGGCMKAGYFELVIIRTPARDKNEELFYEVFYKEYPFFRDEIVNFA